MDSERANKKKLYEVTVSFCVYVTSEEMALGSGKAYTRELQKELKDRWPGNKDMEFFHLETQEVKF